MSSVRGWTLRWFQGSQVLCVDVIHLKETIGTLKNEGKVLVLFTFPYIYINKMCVLCDK